MIFHFIIFRFLYSKRCRISEDGSAAAAFGTTKNQPIRERCTWTDPRACSTYLPDTLIVIFRCTEKTFSVGSELRVLMTPTGIEPVLPP